MQRAAFSTPYYSTGYRLLTKTEEATSTSFFVEPFEEPVYPLLGGLAVFFGAVLHCLQHSRWYRCRRTREAWARSPSAPPLRRTETSIADVLGRATVGGLRSTVLGRPSAGGGEEATEDELQRLLRFRKVTRSWSATPSATWSRPLSSWATSGGTLTSGAARGRPGLWIWRAGAWPTLRWPALRRRSSGCSGPRSRRPTTRPGTGS